MSDKDQFTFEDDDDFPETNLGAKNEPEESVLSDEDSSEFSLDVRDLDDQDESAELDLSYEDDFPETDLSAAFLEGEHSAEDSGLDVAEPTVRGDGNPRTRILLVILLLVIAGGAGAYYFMDLGGTTPSVPTVPVPVQKTTKSVALPAMSEKAPATPANVETAAKPVTVAVPPPPAESAAQVPPVTKSIAVATSQADPAAMAEEKVVTANPKVEPVQQPATQVAVPAPQPKAAEAKAASESAPVLAPQKAAVSVPLASTSAVSTKAAAPPRQVVGGAFTLDAGSYLFDSSRESLVAKIKKLGYEPLVTPVDATLDMTRLRLGTFSKDEVQEALNFARSIEPGSYSAPAGDGYVVYAGTFLRQESIDNLSQRFLKEGVKVHPEPVQVVRTLSRIRFGSFATKEAAAAVASELSQSGLKSAVVKSKQ